MTDLTEMKPDTRVGVRQVFGIDSNLTVPAFSERDAHVPEVDPVYRFNPDVTLAILAGFAQDRRVMIQGLHGSGKSTHIEQVAARLNWPCVRVNLDSRGAHQVFEAFARYQAGAVNFLDVVDAEQARLLSLLAQERTLREQQLTTVRLMKALGGGWDEAGAL